MREICVVCLLMWLVLPVRAVDPSLFPQVEQMLELGEDYGIEQDSTLEQGLNHLLAKVEEESGSLLHSGSLVAVRLLGVVLLCGLAESASVGRSALAVTKLAGALAVTMLSVGSVDAMIGLGRETIKRLHSFSQLLLPAMAALTAATGQVTGAAMRQGATVLFAQLLMQTIDQLLIPLVYAYIACSCAHAAVGNDGLKKLGGMLKGGITAILTGILLLFVAYLTVSGAIVGSADAAAVKAAKVAISRVVPVVGGVLSDAAETVLIGAGALRGSVGVIGLLVVLTICVGPFLQLAVHYLTYKLTAALTGTVAEPRLSGLLDSIGGAFGLVLGMTGACAVMLLISVVAAISAVSV